METQGLEPFSALVEYMTLLLISLVFALQCVNLFYYIITFISILLFIFDSFLTQNKEWVIDLF